MKQIPEEQKTQSMETKRRSMKKRCVVVVLACVLVLSAALTAGAFAASPVSATLRPDLTICIDGAARDFYNAQGKEVHPILYKGTTYLPIRAIGEIMGKNVNWDETTGTATLSGERITGSVAGTPDTGAKSADVTVYLCPEYHIVIDGTERQFADVNGKRVDPVVYNGSIYLPIRAIGEIMGRNVSWDGKTGTVELTASTGSTVTDFDTATPSPAPSTGTTETSAVTAEQAKQIALDHAGVKAADAVFYKTERERENGRLVYEVEFVVVSGSKVSEYDYEIDASTGKILSFDYDIESYAPTTSGTAAVSVDTAKQTVLARVPGATAADIREWEYDYDDGRAEYEGEIIYNGMEYEFTVDASTGKITEWKEEPLGR